jgi:hypothetical protein
MLADNHFLKQIGIFTQRGNVDLVEKVRRSKTSRREWRKRSTIFLPSHACARVTRFESSTLRRRPLFRFLPHEGERLPEHGATSHKSCLPVEQFVATRPPQRFSIKQITHQLRQFVRIAGFAEAHVPAVHFPIHFDIRH